MIKPLKKILYFLNYIFPIFPKDSFYSYDFNTKSIRLTPYLYSRKYEMQYYCDYNGINIITRYSKYINRKEFGVITHNKHYKNVNKVSEDLKNIRLFQGKIYTSKDGYLYCYSDEKVYPISISEDFDFLHKDGNDYILIDTELYRINDCHFNLSDKKTLTFNNAPKIRNNYSVCQQGDTTYLTCRQGDYQALETKIALYASNDMINYQFQEILVDSINYKHIGIDGVGFPVIRNIDDKLNLIFVGYWGRHLLRKKTVNTWKNK